MSHNCSHVVASGREYGSFAAVSSILPWFTPNRGRNRSLQSTETYVTLIATHRLYVLSVIKPNLAQALKLPGTAGLHFFLNAHAGAGAKYARISYSEIGKWSLGGTC